MTNKIWQAYFSHEDILVESSLCQYQGHFRLDELVIKFKKFDNQWTSSVVREKISRANAVAVLLYDPLQDKVVLVEQLRVGCIQDQSISSPWLLELVAGLVSPGEDAQETAIREIEEEAGVKLEKQNLISIGEYYNTPGAFTERTSVYCALVDSTHLGGIFGLEHEHENIKVHALAFQSIFKQLAENQFLTSASTVIALQWLKLNRENFYVNKVT